MGSPFRPQTASYRTAEKESRCAAQQILLAKDCNGSEAPDRQAPDARGMSASPPIPTKLMRRNELPLRAH